MGCNWVHDSSLHTITNERWSKNLRVLYQTGSDERTLKGEKINRALFDGPRMDHNEVKLRYKINQNKFKLLFKIERR